MKKLYYLLIVPLILLSCKKAKPLMVYTLSIERNERDINGLFMPSNKLDTIMAVDDTLAYEKGLTKYYGGLIAESLVPNAMYQNKSFTVKDTSGLDISYKLPQKTIDSLTTMVKKFADEQLSKAKH